MEAYIGIDVGSVTTKFAVLDESNKMVAKLYLTTDGKPLAAVQGGLKKIRKQLPVDMVVSGVGATGSARYLVGEFVGADLIKNEITCHAVSAIYHFPEVQTVIEIGGQDSKIIIVRDEMVTDFGMNTVCAAGTGSFLDHQARRLNMNIEEFARIALESNNPVRIAGRCTVFAESDMIHKQQSGNRTEDIVFGLCQSLVSNYLSNVGLGKDIRSPIVFQGGVAFNLGIVKALEEELNVEVIVPAYHEVMGAIGAALLIHEESEKNNQCSNFKGFDISEVEYCT